MSSDKLYYIVFLIVIVAIWIFIGYQSPKIHDRDNWEPTVFPAPPETKRY